MRDVGPISIVDGTPVVVRPVRPADRPHFEEAIRELSARSLFHRFNGSFRPSNALWEYLTRVDQHDHIAVCAIDVGGPVEHGIGVARCVRRAAEPPVAELAVTVIDRCQAKGVGSMLLAYLSHDARAAGIDTFVAYVDSGRRSLLRFLGSLPDSIIRHADGVTEVHFRVLDDPDIWPDTEYGRLGRSVLIHLGQ